MAASDAAVQDVALWKMPINRGALCAVQRAGPCSRTVGRWADNAVFPQCGASADTPHVT